MRGNKRCVVTNDAGLEPAARDGLVSDAVFTRLAEEILSGRWQPNHLIPPERQLAEDFEVNRHAVREALKRLQQAGLVLISQGGKTKVLDWRLHASLDVLSAVAAAGAIPAGKVMADFAVMRRAIASDAARSAVKCLLSDRQQLTSYLRFPIAHHRRIRHSNFIERTFGETRRRVKVIGRLPGESSCLNLVWAVLDRASRGWRGMAMTPPGTRLLAELRHQLFDPPTPIHQPATEPDTATPEPVGAVA